MPFSSLLSLWVLLAFVATALALTLVVRAAAREDDFPVWLVAALLIVVPLSLQLILATLGWLIERTPALLHGGFFLWTFTLVRPRRPAAPPAPAAVVVLALVPLVGCALSLPALWGDRIPWPAVPAGAQAALIALLWLAHRRHPLWRSAKAAVVVVERRVFLSYRRDDSADVTGRIYDRLVAQFGQTRVFKDVDSIPAGADFRAALHDAVDRCEVVMVVIGPRWLTATTGGVRRLDDPGDFVRIEIAHALDRKLPVVPVLVGGAAMPAERDLPPTLSALAFRQALVVRPDPDFHRDVDRLIVALSEAGAAAASA